MDIKTKSKKNCICPNCGTEMRIESNGSSSFFVCPDCGCSINSELQYYFCENLCPSCYQELDGNECYYCGYDLGSDFD